MEMSGLNCKRLRQNATPVKAKVCIMIWLRLILQIIFPIEGFLGHRHRCNFAQHIKMCYF